MTLFEDTTLELNWGRRYGTRHLTSTTFAFRFLTEKPARFHRHSAISLHWLRCCMNQCATGLLGPNGSGKSTLLDAISGWCLMPSSQGMPHRTATNMQRRAQCKHNLTLSYFFSFLFFSLFNFIYLIFFLFQNKTLSCQTTLTFSTCGLRLTHQTSLPSRLCWMLMSSGSDLRLRPSGSSKTTSVTATALSTSTSVLTKWMLTEVCCVLSHVLDATHMHACATSLWIQTPPSPPPLSLSPSRNTCSQDTCGAHSTWSWV